MNKKEIDRLFNDIIINFSDCYNELIFNLYEDTDGYSLDATFDDEEIDLNCPAILTKENLEWKEVLTQIEPYIKDFVIEKEQMFSSLSKIAYGFVDGDLIYLKNKKCKIKKSEKQEKIFSYEHFKDFDATKLSAWVILYMKDNAKNKFNPPFNFNNMTKEELSVWAKRLADNFDYKKYRSFK